MKQSNRKHAPPDADGSTSDLLAYARQLRIEAGRDIWLDLRDQNGERLGKFKVRVVECEADDTTLHLEMVGLNKRARMAVEPIGPSYGNALGPWIGGPSLPRTRSHAGKPARPRLCGQALRERNEEMRRLRRQGMTVMELAAKFDLNHSTVSKVTA